MLLILEVDLKSSPIIVLWKSVYWSLQRIFKIIIIRQSFFPIAQKDLLGNNNLVMCSLVGTGLWTNPLLFWTFNEFPAFSPITHPCFCQACCSEVLLDVPHPHTVQATATLCTLGHDLCSSLANAHGCSRKNAESSSSSSFCCYWYPFYFFIFSLFKSQVKEQIIWIISINSNTETCSHFYKASQIIPIGTKLENSWFLGSCLVLILCNSLLSEK